MSMRVFQMYDKGQENEIGVNSQCVSHVLDIGPEAKQEPSVCAIVMNNGDRFFVRDDFKSVVEWVHASQKKQDTFR